jgi:hypothetical protein
MNNKIDSFINDEIVYIKNGFVRYLLISDMTTKLTK